MSLRSYQEEAIAKASRLNSLVVLPTGSGKTRVGAGIVQTVGWPALFIVPKKILVEQQARAIEEHFAIACRTTGGDPTKRGREAQFRPPGSSRPRVVRLFGGRAFPTGFDIIVTTPAALWNNKDSVPWAKLRCVIFDECHHTRGDDPFALIAKAISNPANSLFPRVVGLSASLGYRSELNQLVNEFTSLTRLLRISQVIMFDSKRLEAEGFTGHQGREHLLDEYRCFNPSRIPREPVPHEPWQSLERAVRFGRASEAETFLVGTVRLLEALFDNILPTHGGSTESFWSTFRSNTPLKDWGKTSGELVEQQRYHVAPAIQPLFVALPFWYEAFRITAVSDPDGADIAITYLRMMGQHQGPSVALLLQDPSYPYSQSLQRFLVSPDIGSNNEDTGDDFYRLRHLRQSLIEAVQSRQHGSVNVPPEMTATRKRCRTTDESEEEVEDQEESKPFRGIVFVEHRIVAHVLDWWIQQQPDLLPKVGIRSTALFATNDPCAYRVRVSPSEMAGRLEMFRSGRVNLLITTAVAEEGMDVPKANHVIRFDRVRHAVAHVQGQGRAREEGAQHVLLQNGRGELDRFDNAIAYGAVLASTYQPPEEFRAIEESIQAHLSAGQQPQPRGPSPQNPFPVQHPTAPENGALNLPAPPITGSELLRLHEQAEAVAQAQDWVSIVHRWRDQHRLTHRIDDEPRGGIGIFRHAVRIVRLADGVPICNAESANCKSKKSAKNDAFRKVWRRLQDEYI